MGQKGQKNQKLIVFDHKEEQRHEEHRTLFVPRHIKRKYYKCNNSACPAKGEPFEGGPAKPDECAECGSTNIIEVEEEKTGRKPRWEKEKE